MTPEPNPVPVTPGAAPRTPLEAFANWRRRFVVPRSRQAEVVANVADGAALRPRYGFMIVMACGIAILGLLQNSAAVISPLMAPIVALGFSLCLLDYDEMRRSLVTLAVGVALALGIAILVVTVSPLREATPEILARTQPTLFDLLVAVFSGLAGGYAVVQGRGETIVGVAIATALMPPLAVTGYGLATHQMGIATGAGFLFMTNLLAIAFSVSIVARWYGFGTHNSPKSSAWQAAVIVLTFAALSVPLGISLTSIAQRGAVERTARTEIEDFLREHSARLSSLRVQAPADGTVQVDLVALTRDYQPSIARELEELLHRRLSRDVALSIQQLVVAEQDPRDTVRSLAQMQASLNALQQEARVRDPADEFRERLAEGAGQLLGAVSLDAMERRATVYLRQGSGYTLADARELERRLAEVDPGWTVAVIPSVRPLPALYFEPAGTTLTDEHVEELEALAWAFRQWDVTELEVTGFASSDGATRHNRSLAEQRANEVAQWLAGRGFAVRSGALFDRRSQGVLERELGHAQFRRVEIRPEVLATPEAAPG
jgi:uncharacterized hydrophobic protein (TIGR00271 family)